MYLLGFTQDPHESEYGFNKSNVRSIFKMEYIFMSVYLLYE